MGSYGQAVGLFEFYKDYGDWKSTEKSSLNRLSLTAIGQAAIGALINAIDVHTVSREMRLSSH